ncbi:MAG: glycosyltransferase [Gammaproteobacteria bacterium]|nr:glycosyltransferase [Pseudomonadales bacterium]MCP5345776.1 glycosyltransferase [Pseudomonadales bacterium]
MNNSISVIIPTFNRARALPRALNSVLSQTLPPAEVIVVDDGSTDDTAALLGSEFPSVRYLQQPNRGVSAARNLGVAVSRGHWLAFLDSDDEWFPEKLERQMELIERHPDAQVCHSDEIWIRNGRRVNPMQKHTKRGGHIFENCLPLCAMSPSSVVLRRELFEGLNGFDETLPACEDYDLWLRICSRYPVLYVDVPLLRKYGGHDDQLSRQYWGMDRFRVAALQKILGTGILDESQQQAARRTLVAKCRVLSIGALKRGRRDRAEYYGRIAAIHSEQLAGGSGRGT